MFHLTHFINSLYARKACSVSWTAEFKKNPNTKSRIIIIPTTNKSLPFGGTGDASTIKPLKSIIVSNDVFECRLVWARAKITPNNIQFILLFECHITTKMIRFLLLLLFESHEPFSTSQYYYLLIVSMHFPSKLFLFILFFYTFLWFQQLNVERSSIDTFLCTNEHFISREHFAPWLSLFTAFYSFHSLYSHFFILFFFFDIYKYGQTFSLTSRIQSNEIIRNKIKNVFVFSFSAITKQLFASSLTRESRTLVARKKNNNVFCAVRLFFVVLWCRLFTNSRNHRFPDVFEFKLWYETF